MMEDLRKICEDFGYQLNGDAVPAELINPLSRIITADLPFKGDPSDRETGA
jgi:hypothetical protein